MYYSKTDERRKGIFIPGKFWLSVLFLLLVFSCQERTIQSAVYYPVDSLVAAQQSVLSGLNAVLRKSTRLNSASSVIELTPGDSLHWANELQIFASLEVINKPTYRGEYSEQREDQSGLQVWSFTSLKDDVPVRYLKIFYDRSPENIRRIEAKWQEKNIMFRSQRLFTLHFNAADGHNLLQRFEVRGGQKMFLQDTVSYSIEGEVLLPAN